MQPYFEIAYAKINLALHVRRRRDDGYHELESLVAFLDYGDFIYAEKAETDSLVVEGDFAECIGVVSDNLVMRALRWARGWTGPVAPPLAIRLVKQLPVAAGLGGGSADAAALLRLLAKRGQFIGLYDFAPAMAELGADVPACVYSSPLFMRGIGEQIEQIGDGSLANIFALLVNPAIPVPTGPVFAAWDKIDRGPLPGGTAIEIAIAGRNDLQAPAIALCPIISDVLAMLDATRPIAAKMSGSGATCFALYDDPEKGAAAARHIQLKQPDWWVMSGNLRS